MVITKFPVVIIAPARTGSTALLYHIARINNLTAWSEPCRSAESFNKFFESIKTDDRWALKFLANSLKLYPTEFIEKALSGDYYTIKLKRNNILEQIASHYISVKRQEWVYHKSMPHDKHDEIIDIDYDIISTSIGGVLDDNCIIDTLNTDDTLIYEEILPILDKSLEFQKTPMPANFKEIVEAILDVKKNSSYGVTGGW